MKLNAQGTYTVSNPPTFEEVAFITDLYFRWRWNVIPTAVTVQSANAPTISLDMPKWAANLPTPTPAQPSPAPTTTAPAEESRAVVQITRVLEDQHTDDYTIVLWQGVRYQLTRKQSQVVRALWEAWREGQPDVSQRELLKAADSDGVRLVDLFRRNPAWNNLIVSVKQGYYRLVGSDIEISDAG